MYRLDCGYNLRNGATTICPECGRMFDPDDRETYARRPLHGSARRLKRLLGVIIVGIGLPPLFLLYMAIHAAIFRD